MAHLTDMEELVTSVQSEEIRDYMSESLACYMAGAYRASVVLTFTALFDDILSKLTELGKVNKKAKAIADEASKRRADQDVFENYMIEKLKTDALLSALDAEFLDMLRTLRNKAAHPSGHHASAEEARWVFREAVVRFLSKPILSTTQLADEVLASLANSNLFPSTNVGDIEMVVKAELSNIHPDTYPYLVTKVLEKTQPPGTDTAKNAVFFLVGLARIGDAKADEAVKKYAVEQAAANKAYQSIIVTVLSASGKLFQGLHEVSYQRLATLVSDRIAKVDPTLEHSKLAHPACLFISLFAANDFAFVQQKLGPQFDAFLEKFTYSPYFGSKVGTLEAPRAVYFEKLLTKAGSFDFATANAFAKNLGDLDKVLGDHLQPEDAFKLLVNVLDAANTGAYAAMDVRNARFAVAPKLRSKANDWLLAEPVAAKAAAEAVLKVAGAELDEKLDKLKPEA